MLSAASVSYSLSDEGQEWVPTPSGDRSFSVTGDFQEPLFLYYGIPVSLLGDDGVNCIPGENLKAMLNGLMSANLIVPYTALIILILLPLSWALSVRIRYIALCPFLAALL